MNNNNINDTKLRDVEKLEIILKTTLKTIDFEPDSDIENASTVITALKKIPFISGLLHNATDSGSAVTSLLQPRADLLPSLGEISFVFHIIPIALFGIDLLYILGANLSAYIMNKPSPIEISNKPSDKNSITKKNASPFSLLSLAKVLYSIIFLTIAILVLTIPAVSLPLSLVGGVFGLFVSLQALGTFFYQDHQLRKTKRQTARDLSQVNLELDILKKEVKNLNHSSENTQELASLENTQKLVSLYSRFEYIVNEIKSLKKKDSQSTKELASMDGRAVFSRFLSVMLSSVAIVGIALLFVSPPVASTILLGVSVTAISYTIASKVVPFLLTKSREFATKWKNNTSVVEQSNSKEIVSMTTKPTFLSTTKIFKLLPTLDSKAKPNIEHSVIKGDKLNNSDNTLKDTSVDDKSNLNNTSERTETSYTQTLY